jgi:hypothetical protein
MLRLDLYDAGWLNSDAPELSNKQIAMNSLDKSLLKKFHNDESDDLRDNLALALFLECNERCRTFGDVTPRRLQDDLIINEMKAIIDDFFFPAHWEDETGSSNREPLLLNLSDIATHFGLGNGSNIGCSSTDFYTKYANSTMCHTNEVLPLLFRQAISNDQLWSDIEVSRSSSMGIEIVRGNRLTFVPKSRLISRTICTEPILNMFFQKGIGDVITKRLKEVFCINLSDQPGKNAALARIGSETGEFGTIDLSSASDSISISLLRQILPRQPFEWLMRCRSPRTTLPGGKEIELHMISSMGNGFTFPLQTMIFSALVTAAYRISGLKLQKPRARAAGNFAVFGDDIIVDRRVYDSVVNCLEILGFAVNRDKSFNEGSFRESCGSDFIRGHNVRGVYLKTLNSEADIYSAINRLNRWSSFHGILLARTVGYLRRDCKFICIPYDEADDAGIKVPFILLRNPRYDITQAVRYTARVNRSRRVRIPSVDLDVEVQRKDVIKIRRILPDFEYNPDAVLFCLLAGWLRAGKLGLRTSTPISVLRRRVCPGWDERIAACGVSHEFGKRWKMFTEANLVN